MLISQYVQISNLYIITLELTVYSKNKYINFKKEWKHLHSLK